MPYKKYFKVNNNVFATNEQGEQILTPTQRQVLVMMYSVDINGKGWVKIRQSRLAEMCNCSVATIKRAIEQLIEKGYIYNKIRTERNDRWLGTYIYILPKVAKKGYFYVNRNALKLLNSVQTRMYLYFCKCARNAKKDFWHSFNDIANALHLKRNAVINTIKELVSLKVINKDVRKTSKGDYAENYYTISENFENAPASNNNNCDNNNDRSVTDISPTQYNFKEKKRKELPFRSNSQSKVVVSHNHYSTAEKHSQKIPLHLTDYSIALGGICQVIFSAILERYFSARAGP